MTLISVIFTCSKRLPLTKLCLSRFKEFMPQPYELILVYDGEDVDYLHELIAIISFDYIITNPGKKKNRFYLLNEALDRANGELYMHLEGDFYWEKSGTIEKALEGLDKCRRVDLVRFEYLPFDECDYIHKTQLKDDTLCTLNPDVPYTSFNFSPHLRRYKYPGERFPMRPVSSRFSSEKIFWMQAQKLGYVGACLLDGGFRHLGLFDDAGLYKVLYNQRFTLQRSQRFFDPVAEFNSFCENDGYRRLFREYIDSQKKYDINLMIKQEDPPCQTQSALNSISGGVIPGGELIVPDGVRTSSVVGGEMNVILLPPSNNRHGFYNITPPIIGNGYDMTLGDLSMLMKLFLHR